MPRALPIASLSLPGSRQRERFPAQLRRLAPPRPLRTKPTRSCRSSGDLRAAADAIRPLSSDRADDAVPGDEHRRPPDAGPFDGHLSTSIHEQSRRKLFARVWRSRVDHFQNLHRAPSSPRAPCAIHRPLIQHEPAPRRLLDARLPRCLRFARIAKKAFPALASGAFSKIPKKFFKKILCAFLLLPLRVTGHCQR